MKTLTRPRLAVLVFAALALPALTCGVAPALRDLTLRMQRVESYLAHVNLPPLLVDAHDRVVGPVLDYNRLFLYSSVDSLIARRDVDLGSASFRHELATVLYTPPGGGPPLVLDANREALLTLEHGFAQGYYFESADCSGPAWVFAQFTWHTYPESVYARGRIAPPGRTLYAEDLGAPVQHISVNSYRLSAGWAPSSITEDFEGPCERGSNPNQYLLRPLVPVADLDALFTPPFRLLAQGPMTATP